MGLGRIEMQLGVETFPFHFNIKRSGEDRQVMKRQKTDYNHPSSPKGPISCTAPLKYAHQMVSLFFFFKLHFSTPARIPREKKIKIKKNRERQALLFPSALLSTSGALEVLKVLRNIGYLRVT